VFALAVVVLGGGASWHRTPDAVSGEKRLGGFVRQGFLLAESSSATLTPNEALPDPTPSPSAVALARYSPMKPEFEVRRQALLNTEFPERPQVEVILYEVRPGDTAWSIAQRFGLQPETILWGNEGLSAEAGSLAIGATINILPVDGVLHTVAEGDTLERLALLHGTPIEQILEFPGNDLFLGPPYDLEPGKKIILPGGRNPVVWEEPGPRLVTGLGRRSPGYYSGPLVYVGSGFFIWPITTNIVITQSYWSGHPAIDLDTYFRQPIFAADSGTVIFSGWDKSGYGNLVIIDHGNGYWTYYAHNEANLVSAGQGVSQGQQIAESGSTGNSSGDHLDFRIRQSGGAFLNPLDFLP